MPTKTLPAASAAKRYQRPAQVGPQFGISARTIRRWVAEGKLTGYRIGTRILVVDPDQVAALLRPVAGAGR